MNEWKRSFVAALLVALWLLAGCASNSGPPTPTHPVTVASPTATGESAPSPAAVERDLSFETIERHDISPYYSRHPLEPQHVFLITSAKEASQLTGWVHANAEGELVQLDYQRYFVIALFRGNFASSGYDPIIQRVIRRDDRLVVHVQFWAPSPYYAVTAAGTQPYQVVKVLWDGGPLDAASLILESQTVTPTPPPEIQRLTPTSP